MKRDKYGVNLLTREENTMPTKSISPKDYYGFIAPRPTVCVSTIDEEGDANLAPYSFVTPVSFEPPLIAISVGKKKDTLLNARETKEFVVAPLTEKWMKRGIETEISLPRDRSEFEQVGLNERESKKVKPPCVDEAPVNMECEYWDEYSGEDHLLLVGKVVHISADEKAVENDRLNLEELGSVCHVKGEEFSVGKEIEKIKRD